MPRSSISVLCLGLVLIGCGDGNLSRPTAPSPTAPVTPVVPLPPATRTPVPGFSAGIELGEVVQSRVTADDPVCAAGWPYRCRYYGLKAPSSGWLYVTIGWNPQLASEYPLDLGVIDEQGREWVATAGQPAQRGVSLLATAGTTYIIEVWSFLSPAETFELKTSMFVP